jgi:hypothetical protein
MFSKLDGPTWSRRCCRRHPDAEVQVCTGSPNMLVTSRKPDDLPAFCARLVEVFQREARPA